MDLRGFFSAHTQAAVAFSGGADSAYLLYAGLAYGARLRAYYVKSVFQPEFELDDAKKFAENIGVEMRVINVDVLAEGKIVGNTPDRCYYCKKAIFTAIVSAARRDGFTLVLDGTNASDDISNRPGIRALRELSIRSPLRECGITKPVLRRLSREAGLFTWNKPAYACLATRIPSGTEITRDKLERTEIAENFLYKLGFRDFRVRMLGNSAKLQLTDSDFAKAVELRDAISSELKGLYDDVLLDLEARNG